MLAIERLGFAGVGAMGAGIAQRLGPAGHHVTVWNRTSAKAQPLLDAGMAWAGTPRELAACSDMIFTMLTDSRAIEATADGADRTRVEDVSLEPGLRVQDGWIDMQVQFLIDARAAGSDQLVVGRTVLPPGTRHERHAHPNCDEFLVISGHGEIYTNSGREPARAGDVIYTPRGNWHGSDNTSGEDVLLIWGWTGAGSLKAAGYELPGRDDG